MRHRISLVPVVVLSALLVASLAACNPATAPYTALGDSYVAGPLIPNQTLEPFGCLRSDHDYPQLVASTLGVPVKDVSCSGAETEDMFNEQGVTPGPNPPQLDAVGADTKVVTIGIGGNDIGFSSIVKECIKLNPFDSPCKDHFVTANGDELAQNIAATKPLVANVLNAIHAKNSKTKVLVVGYPTVLPATGNGCWPSIPILPADVAYLRGIYDQLNAMLASAAAQNGATYVDTATGTVGHDVCASDNYIEGISLDLTAAPVHPNAAGMAAIAAIVAPKVLAAL